MYYIRGLDSKNYYGKRGMVLEEDINETNRYYLDNDIAIIYKKPTPIKILKLDFVCCHNAGDHSPSARRRRFENIQEALSHVWT